MENLSEFPDRAYVKAAVSVHGLRRRGRPGPSLEEVLARIESALEAEFGREFESDIEVEALESAGTNAS